MPAWTAWSQGPRLAHSEQKGISQRPCTMQHARPYEHALNCCMPQEETSALRSFLAWLLRQDHSQIESIQISPNLKKKQPTFSKNNQDLQSRKYVFTRFIFSPSSFFSGQRRVFLNSKIQQLTFTSFISGSNTGGKFYQDRMRKSEKRLPHIIIYLLLHGRTLEFFGLLQNEGWF